MVVQMGNFLEIPNATECAKHSFRPYLRQVVNRDRLCEVEHTIRTDCHCAAQPVYRKDKNSETKFFVQLLFTIYKHIS